MEVDFRAFAFVVSLAAVVNGLGIVRWLAGFGEYLRRRQSLEIRHDWVFILFAGHQFLLHILLWWSLWGVRDASNFNFLIYLYMLAGPVLLYLGSSLLAPEVDEEVDLRTHYLNARPAYFSVLGLVWVWAALTGLVLRGEFAPHLPVIILYLVVTVIMRVTASRQVHAVGAVVNWLLLAAFVGFFAMRLGGPA